MKRYLEVHSGFQKLFPVLALLCTAFAFFLTTDWSVEIHRARFRPNQIVHSGDWSPPALRHGREFAVDNLVERPRLALRLPAADAYRIRIFYVLEGKNSATLFVDGQKAGLLKPGKGWQRKIFHVLVPSKENPVSVSIGIPEGRRFTLRRVDYHNYIFRIGNIFLLKPDGGAGARGGIGPLASLLGGMLVLWGVSVWVSRRRPLGVSSAARIFLLPGGIGIALVAIQFATPFAFHARPDVFVGFLFLLAGVGLTSQLGSRASKSETLKRLSLVGGGLAISLVLVEAALRIWDPPISRPRIGSYAQFSPDFGWKNRPGTKGWQVDAFYSIQFNRHGHRGTDYPMKKKSGVFRILGLGDSFTFGWGVEDNDTFLQQMGRRLREAGHNVEVLNAGVSGWHSSQSLHYLRKEGWRFEPDLVVMTFFIDDVKFKTLEAIRSTGLAVRLRQEEAEVAARSKKRGFVRPRIYDVWFNYRKMWGMAETYRRRNMYYTFEDERKDLIKNFDEDPARIEGLAKMVADWKEVREKLGIPILFSFIPAGGALHQPEFQGDARALARLSRMNAIPYLDLLLPLESHPSPRKLYFHPRDVHMSAAGHAVVGKALAEMVLKTGWSSK